MDVESTSAAAPSQGGAARRPIGEFLVERGLVSEDQLKQALAEQRSSGKRLGEILVERGAITRMALASVLGEQWEEAGRHLRAVVPVRLAGGKEADVGLAGGEELTDSLASLQAAVARLEELSGGPGHERVVVGDEAIEASLAALGRQLAELREALAAPMVVETDHLADRLAELDAFLRARDERVDAKLSELADAAAQVPVPVEPDPAIGDRLDRIDAWLREARVETPTAVDPEVAERLARVEALLTEHEPATVDLTPIEQRLDAIDASVTEALTAPVAEAPTEALVARLEALEQSLGAVRAAVEAPREDPVGEALLGRFDQLQAVLAGRDESDRLSGLQDAVQELRSAVEAPRDETDRLAALEHALRDLRHAVESVRDDGVAERLGSLESSVREALAGPVAEDVLGEDLVGRLEALQAVVAGLEGSAGAARSAELAERFGSLEQRLDALRSAVESPPEDGVAERLGALEQVLGGRDLAWEAAVERLGRLEDSVREAVARPEEGIGEAVLGRLEELCSALAGRDESDRLTELRQALQEVRDAVQSPRDDVAGERLAAIEQVLGGRDLAWEATVERLGRLEDSVNEALARPAAESSLGDDLVTRLEALQAVVAGAIESPRDDAVAERLAALEQVLGGRDLAWEAAVERLGRLEDSLREAAARPDGDGVGEAVLARLDELRTTLGARDETDRLAALEGAIHELRSAVESSRDDDVAERLGAVEHLLGGRDRAWEATAEQLGRLEDVVRDATAPHPDGRLDAVLAQLGELRQAVEAPRDDAVMQRLDGLEHTVREATASRHDGRLDEALARLDGLEAIKAALDELRSTAAEPPGARFLEQLVTQSHNQIAERIGELERALQVPETDAAALAERDARIAELIAELNARPAQTPAPADDRPRPGDTTSFLALVPAPDGYRLVAFEGTLPAAGEGLAVPDDDRALVVARLGRSPYPGDARPCAYLQAS